MIKSVVSSLWRHVSGDADRRLQETIQAALEHRADPAVVFFRADDVAVPGRHFGQLIDLFAAHQMPLNLAVVPAWLTPPRWQALNRLGRSFSHLWCWHQHGWRHANHEAAGKKQEFGPARPRRRLADDLAKGRHRLEKIMANDFYPAFTPPWNRCDGRTLDWLAANGYRCVSRSRGSRPPAPLGLTDLEVNVDLHTRREKTPHEGWKELLTELEAALSSGVCGIMIHHQRMNAAAFEWLDRLLAILGMTTSVRPVNFRGLIDGGIQ